MTNPLRLIDFGKDISEVRNEIDANLKLLDDIKIYAAFYDYVRYNEPKYVKMNPRLFKLPRKKAIHLLRIFAWLSFLPVLKGLKDTPYKIHPYFIGTTEALFYFSNKEKLIQLLKTRKAPIKKYYGKLFKELERFSFFNEQSFLEFLETEGKNLNHFQFLENQIAYKDVNFGFYFAFTLRQISAFNINEFLLSQAVNYPTNKDFSHFVRLILIKYKRLISKENKKAAKLWLKHNASLEEISPKDIQLLKEKIDRKPTASPMDVPKGWIRIPSKIPLEKIKAYFSYFCLEPIDSKDGLSFISTEDLDKLFENGLAYPIEEPEEKLVTFNKSSNRPLGNLYYFTYKLYQLNCPNKLTLEEKMHYARFLKHHIKGIDISLKSLSQSLRDDAPKSLKIKKFQEYFNKLNA